jgi:hypothetical protein
MRPMRPHALAGVLLLLALAPNAFAWNGEAHQLVAYIAEERLSDKAKSGVAELLGDAQLSDAEVASWADQIRRDRRETAPWHYVNIPIDADGYDPKRDANGGDNIIDALERQSKVLADKRAPKEERIEALKFVVHLIGDIHQPLHCGDRGDKGGNRRLVFFMDRKKA